MNDAAAIVAERLGSAGLPAPQWGVVLGTGLGKLAERLTETVTFSYTDLPGFPVSTAPGHAGRLVVGRLGEAVVAMLAGRAHLYENRTPGEVTTAVRTLIDLGIENLVLTNASGGLGRHQKPGDVVLIDDQIDWLGRSRPWIGGTVSGTEHRPSSLSSSLSLSSSSPRPGIGAVYDAALTDRFERVARRLDVPLTRGTYVAVPGPNYETRAEYRFFRRIGGAVVGMSTAAEAVAARRAGVAVAGLSVIGNVAVVESPPPVPTTTEAVEAAAARGAAAAGALIAAVIGET